MKIVFFGSDDFALVHLEALINSAHEVVACVTQPDKPKGRGMKIVVSPIKACAQENQIPFAQPANLKEASFSEQMKMLNPDLFVVIAYGRLLPEDVLALPGKFTINVHSSLLPKYRGAAPINWAIINGDQETGITIMKMNAQLDAGDIIAVEKLGVEPIDTAVTLREKMMKAGPSLLLETLKILDEGSYQLAVQDERSVTLAPKLTKELGKIDWKKSAEEIHNLVRGLQPWPNAYTFYDDKSLKILSTSVVSEESNQPPGTVVDVKKQGIVVATGENALLIREVHLQAAKPMDAASFVRGHELEVGYKFE